MSAAPSSSSSSPALLAASATSDPASLSPFPISRLYRHALESVLSFSSLQEINRLQLVCKGWMTAARTAPSVRGGVPDRVPLSSVLNSPLLRHVTRWRCEANVQLDNEMLRQIQQRLPQMDALDCRMFRPLLPPGETLLFPARLRRVDLLVIRPAKAFDLNSALRNLADLPVLETLSLQLSHLVSAMSFEPLVQCSTLRQFELRWARSRQELTDAHVDSIRRIASLEALSIEGMDLPLLTRLTRRPHALRWRRITAENGDVLLNDDDGARKALGSLQSLQYLRARLVGNTVDFLLHLPQLTSLHLDCYAIDSSTTDRLARGLQACSLLTHLHIRAGHLTSGLLEQILPCMPQLQRLELWSQDRLTSLSFLSKSPYLPSRLVALELNICVNLHPSELRHLDALQYMRECRMPHCFTQRLDEAELLSFTPPSERLPQLQSFEYMHEFWTWRSLEPQRQAMVGAKPAATSAAAAAPLVESAVSRLCSLHLQRIFSFCHKHDLPAVTAVSRVWMRAATTMRIRAGLGDNFRRRLS